MSSPYLSRWCRQALWRAGAVARIALVLRLTACERLAAPPCPAEASSTNMSRPASPPITAAYFASADANAANSSILRWAAGDLLAYREAPLAIPAHASSDETYRVLTTGSFGKVVRLEATGHRHTLRAAARALCEDSDYGVTTRTWNDTIPPDDWGRFSGCMQREFWQRATPDDDPRVTVEGYVVVCGPGANPINCVGSELPFTVVEGVRGRDHVVRSFAGWQPRGRHSGLASCLAIVEADRAR